MPRAGSMCGWPAACALIAFAGFAPTYWLQLPAGTFVGSPLLHLHGRVVLGLAALSVLLQTTLAAAGPGRAVIAPGACSASRSPPPWCSSASRSRMTLWRQDWRRALATGRAPFTSRRSSLITLFGVFVFAAIAYVARPEVHKRLMLLATISMIPPAIARLFFAVNVGIGPGLRPGLGPPRIGGVRAGPGADRRCLDPRWRDLRHAHARPAASRVPRRRRHHGRRPGSACAR